MGPIERWVRRKLNPRSTAVTVRWHGGWRRPGSRSFEFGPPKPARAGSGVSAVVYERSPGSWQVPAGERPGWSWVPSQGAMANPRSMPMWVRLWYVAPFVDRYAYEWMWWHGGWAVPIEPPDPGARV
jgi:hypothetical protein